MIRFPTVTVAALSIGVAALPGLARAGTSIATGTADLDVINQCSVSGATVNLGNYTASQTLGDIVASLGGMDYGPVYTAGNRGQDYLTWGTVNCDSGTPYSLSIQGTATISFSPGGIYFEWRDAQNSRYTAIFDIYVKSIGGTTVADSVAAAPGAGARANVTPAAGIGTGAPQLVKGSAVWNYDASMSQLYDSVPQGSLTDSLTYTLNF